MLVEGDGQRDTSLHELERRSGRDPDVPRAEATGAHLLGAGVAPFILLPMEKLVPTGGGRQQPEEPV